MAVTRKNQRRSRKYQVSSTGELILTPGPCRKLPAARSVWQIGRPVCIPYWLAWLPGQNALFRLREVVRYRQPEV